VSSCIYHASNKVTTAINGECLLLACKNKTKGGDPVCKRCLSEIETRVGRIISNNRNTMSVQLFFFEVFQIKSMWPTSISTSVNHEGVTETGIFKRRQHPVVFMAWPIIWRHIKACPDFYIDPTRIWATWKWIETKLEVILPKVILYSQIVDYIVGINERHVISFRTAVSLGRTEKFKGIDGNAVHIVTPLGCYNPSMVMDALNMADQSGISVTDLMKEDENMASFIETLVAKGDAMVANRRVYSKRYLKKVHCYESRFKKMWGE
jgi:hypothetical protein